MLQQKKKEVVHYFLDKGILLSDDLVLALDDEQALGQLYHLVRNDSLSDLVVLNEDITKLLKNKVSLQDVSQKDLDHMKVKSEKQQSTHYKEAVTAVQQLSDENESENVLSSSTNSQNSESLPLRGSVQIKINHDQVPVKRTMEHFVQYYGQRYSAIEKILRQRQELASSLSINRILAKKDRETLSCIGMVKEVRATKNEHLMVIIEDLTGEIPVLINKNKPELYERAKQLVTEEVIGVVGTNGNNILFGSDFYQPDVPLGNPLKKSPDETYALFLSDLHIGSNEFMEESFQKFIDWLNQKKGNEEQQRVSSLVKYIFIIGDLIDGVGIYPGQEKDLAIPDIYDQYNECAKYLARIPKDIPIIICAGNHDAVRLAEPQPVLDPDYAKAIWELPNVIMVSNPSYVNIHQSETFPGFDILMYHGYSFDHFIAHVDSIRHQGGYDRADLVMKFLLQRRHLAPSHTATLSIPETTLDPLVIDPIPDFFVTGHIHKSSVSHYRNVTLLSSSCFQDTTDFQRKVGHHPEPCRVPLVNLQTRAVKIMRFE